MIGKRTLRFVQTTPLLAVCEYCKMQFSGSEAEIRQQFLSHTCERSGLGEGPVTFTTNATGQK